LPLPPGRYVKITVRDTGIGIPEEHLDKIFDPYFTTKQTGSGLGLATSYSIIKKHNGHIAVESRPGQGTAFYVYLPASQTQAAPIAQAQGTPRAGKGRVLVMDDEETIRNLAGRILAHLGYEAGLAENGEEAIEMYRQAKRSGRPFDVVIMDLTIPGGMGGKEAIRRLLEIDPGVKAIVSSGYSNDPVMADFRRYGFKGVVTKPYRIADLGEALHDLMAEPPR
ncbi:MAG TPA: ATP-binding protein, partial [Blastocatellia bacterium]|nr:ATP-binding protein [Blastocatellia bacterium]